LTVPGEPQCNSTGPAELPGQDGDHHTGPADQTVGDAHAPIVSGSPHIRESESIYRVCDDSFGTNVYGNCCQTKLLPAAGLPCSRPGR
jgi:hypothetical protein